MKYGISPGMLVVFIFISLVVGMTIGDKRRIGIGWSMFFTFFWIIPGIILTVLSPPLKSLPQPNEKDKSMNTVWAVIFFLLAAASIYRATSTPSYMRYGREGSVAYQILISILFAGTALFFLNRYERHKTAWEKQQLPKDNTPTEGKPIVEEPEKPFEPETPNYEIAEKEK